MKIEMSEMGKNEEYDIYQVTDNMGNRIRMFQYDFRQLTQMMIIWSNSRERHLNNFCEFHQSGADKEEKEMMKKLKLPQKKK